MCQFIFICHNNKFSPLEMRRKFLLNIHYIFFVYVFFLIDGLRLNRKFDQYHFLYRGDLLGTSENGQRGPKTSVLPRRP